MFQQSVKVCLEASFLSNETINETSMEEDLKNIISSIDCIDGKVQRRISNPITQFNKDSPTP